VNPKRKFPRLNRQSQNGRRARRLPGSLKNISSYFGAFAVSKSESRKRKANRTNRAPSRFSIAFLFVHFSVEFICRSHLGRGTCIMDGSRVLNPTFPILRVSSRSPRSTCLFAETGERLRPSSWISNPNCLRRLPVFPSCRVTSVREEISSNAENCRGTRRVKI